MGPAWQIALKMAYFHVWESGDTSVYAAFTAVACPQLCKIFCVLSELSVL